MLTVELCHRYTFIRFGSGYSTSSSSLELLALSVFILRRYKEHEIALNCGVILRECIRYESLANAILEDGRFFSFFEYVEKPKTNVPLTVENLNVVKKTFLKQSKLWEYKMARVITG